MNVTFDGTTLVFGKNRAEPMEILGFHERFSSLTGGAWLEVRGPNWNVPLGEGYGALRRALRAAFPNLPFSSDWMDGRFPTSPGGVPGGLATLLGFAGALAVVLVASVWAGTIAGAAAALAVAWPVIRLRDAVLVRSSGMRVGPVWAARVPWQDVLSVRVSLHRRHARVWMEARRGTSFATVPIVLLPALRARLWRLSAIALEEGRESLDEAYGQWRGPASGIPWGILLGALGVAPFTSIPWIALASGLLASAATGLLAAAVEARSSGWGAGAILWMTAAYGVVLAAIGLGSGGWFVR